jgi:hypothetical protein
MSSENLHAPRERLSPETLNLHFTIVSLMEELDAIDWYRQRADEAHVRPTLEIILIQPPSYLHKRKDPETGLALIVTDPS